MILVKPYNILINMIGFLVGQVIFIGLKHGLVHFPFASETLSRLPFSWGWKLRRAAYSQLLPAIGHDAVLHFGVVLEDPRTTIGQDVWISAFSYIEFAEIGDHVLVGPYAVLLCGKRSHNIDRIDIPIKSQGNPPKTPLKVGAGSWIGANATIMAEVGHDAIVGAGSVVTRPVPPFAVVAGNPARLLRYRHEVGNHTT